MFKVGDRVIVIDEGLAQLRAIMREATGSEPPPNHTGTIREVWTDSALIRFDDTQQEAPYSFAEIRPLSGGPAEGERDG